jgi:hypothetical protein
MKLRALFLGTAAAFAVSGGAQAADLALAVEPIDYVKVCDAFGTGYYYIPGTDTCLKVGGYIQLDVWFRDSDSVGNYFNATDTLTGFDPTADNPLASTPGINAQLLLKDSYSASWELTTEAGVNFTAKSMSDLGPIVTHFNFVTVSNNNDFDGTTKTVRFDGGYGAIGPAMFGWTASTFEVGGGYTYDGAVRSDTKVDQFRLSYLMGTWGIMLGLEDPRDRYGAAPKNATGDYPDIVLALTGGVGGFDVKASGAITDRTSGTGWAVALAGEVDLGAAAKLKVAGAYSDNAYSYVSNYAANCSGKCDDGQWWSVFVSGIVALSGNLDAAATASWVVGDGGASYKQRDLFEGAIGMYYHPTSNSEIGLEFLYIDPDGSDDSWGVHGRFKTTF